MTITSLRITNFRNLAAVDLAPSGTGLNIICGNNGSGKTSLLEAIYYLGLGRSFRSAAKTSLIRHTTDKFSIFSQLLSESERFIPLGLEREINGATRLRVAEQDASSLAELASYLPLRIINSQSHQLFESGPTHRRKFLDWGLFYQAENFLSCWRHFERVLKQRNAVLSDRRPKNELNVWTDELVKYGLELDTLRRDYISALKPLLIHVTQELLGSSCLEMTYQPGWDESMDYAAFLEKNYIEEYRSQYTQFGPHRADLTLAINGIPVKHFLSRGQQKLLICAMIIAQGKLLSQRTNKKLIYLIDDLPAELDLLSRQKLISLLAEQQTQVFITAIENDAIYNFISDQSRVPVKVFHVEHGGIVEMTHLRRS
jgi:DNA replication and repair protein RecF